MTMNRLAKRLERIARDVTAADEGMKFVIKGKVWCETWEDDYEQGQVFNSGTSWDTTVSGRFDTIEDLLKAVCTDVVADYDKNAWAYEVREDGVRFSGSFGFYDEDNNKADNSDIELWKKGEKKLWVMDVDLLVQKVGISVPDSSDLSGFEEM